MEKIPIIAHQHAVSTACADSEVTACSSTSHTFNDWKTKLKNNLTELPDDKGTMAVQNDHKCRLSSQNEQN